MTQNDSINEANKNSEPLSGLEKQWSNKFDNAYN